MNRLKGTTDDLDCNYQVTHLPVQDQEKQEAPNLLQHLEGLPNFPSQTLPKRMMPQNSFRNIHFLRLHQATLRQHQV
jgi:hypothetical protein